MHFVIFIEQLWLPQKQLLWYCCLLVLIVASWAVLQRLYNQECNWNYRSPQGSTTSTSFVLYKYFHCTFHFHCMCSTLASVTSGFLATWKDRQSHKLSEKQPKDVCKMGCFLCMSFSLCSYYWWCKRWSSQILVIKVSRTWFMLWLCLWCCTIPEVDTT